MDATTRGTLRPERIFFGKNDRASVEMTSCMRSPAKLDEQVVSREAAACARGDLPSRACITSQRVNCRALCAVNRSEIHVTNVARLRRTMLATFIAAI